MSDATHANWFRDPAYLQTQQYGSDRNLAARMAMHARFSTSAIDWYAWQFERLLPLMPADGRILEVGCGPAAFWAFNLAQVPDHWSITLTDLSPGMLEAGQARLGGSDASARFVWQQAAADALPFADESFDVVMAHHMLYHVPDLTAALRELRRVLRPGGVLLAATNGSAHLQELEQLLVRVHGAVHLAGNAEDATGREQLARAFGLENGAGHLSHVFRDVSLDLFPDSLRVTDAEAVLAYLRSTPDGAELSDAQAEQVRAIVRQALQQQGAFHVTKSTGMFRAHR